MSRVGAEQNEIFGWHEMQRRDTTLVEISGSKTISPFDKVSNITSTSWIEHNSDIQKCP